ncbi:MAG: hypothetical protein H0V75_04640 [Rubrobacter sp.]|jgi:hypothetical protein|nr:hypothetical protein [Rubrobacter sp.]
MTWTQVIGQLITVGITGLVAILSARYGAKSSIDAAERQAKASLEVTEKNNQAALKRIQYERTHQRREEAIAELYARLKELERTFLSVSTKVVGEDVLVDKRADSQELERILSETRNSLDKDTLWLTPDSVEGVDKLLSKYLAHIGWFNLILYRELLVLGEGTVAEKEYDEALNELSDWFHGEYPSIEKEITKSFKRSLNIIDPSSEPYG